jgi:hypothetical protein
VIGKEGSEELCVRFGDLPLKAKKIIFERVVDSVCLKGGKYTYKDQEVDCRKIVACKIVNKTWKYLINKTCNGKELRMGCIRCN